MGQKAYTASLRFGRLDTVPPVQAFGRKPVWFQSFQTKQLWKHLRARTPFHGNEERFLSTPKGIRIHFDVVGWHTPSQFVSKPTKRVGPTPSYRFEDRSLVLRRKRALAKKRIGGLPSILLGVQFVGLKRVVRRGPTRLRTTCYLSRGKGIFAAILRKDSQRRALAAQRRKKALKTVGKRKIIRENKESRKKKEETKEFAGVGFEPTTGGREHHRASKKPHPAGYIPLRL